MKKLALFIIAAGVFFLEPHIIFSQVFDPSDPLVEYDPDSPPTKPAWGTVSKWVRTTRLSWDTDAYKAYYFNGMCFRLMFPKDYDASGSTQYPLIIMLHGRGEGGTIYDNEYSMRHGGARHRDVVANGEYDGFVLYPQSTNGFWGDSNFAALHDLINDHLPQVNIDLNRVSIHGLSSGGQGVIRFITKYPKNFSSAIPMSAASLSFIDGIPNYQYIPIWLSQGGQDTAPDPGTTQVMVDAWDAAGMNYTYLLYPDLGHGVWNRHYGEPDFFPFMIRSNRTNPHVFYGKREFCPGEVVSARLGLTAGFESYEWRKDGVVIVGATSNEYIATEFGTYDARIKEDGEWSYWSPAPVVISLKGVTAPPPIGISGLESKVLPSPDGSNSVHLEVPDNNYVEYKWTETNSTTVLGTERIFEATSPGDYTVSVLEEFGCASENSAAFKVVDANGSGGPGAVIGTTAFADSKTSIKIRWSDNGNTTDNEIGYEVYRAGMVGGPYEFVGITEADAIEYQDQGLVPNTRYYYLIRAVNENGASQNSEEVSAITLSDTVSPVAPLNLSVSSTTNNSVSLSWDASTDDVGIDRYEVYRDGIRAAVVNGTSVTIYNLEFQKVYNFYVISRDLSGNYSPVSEQVTASPVNSGLTYKYYQGSWSQLPNFNSLTPIKEGVSQNLDISVRERDNEFGFLWEGTINIPVTGNYTFETYSDDGSKLYIGGYDESNLVVDNDGLHGSRYREGTIFLDKGFYPIAIAFFERGGGQQMQVYWKNTAHGVTSRQEIPDNFFTEGFTLPDVAPAAPTDVLASASAYDKVSINWTDESSNESSFQIFRATELDGTYYPIGVVLANSLTFVDSVGLEAGTEYFYGVKARNSSGESGLVKSISPATTLPLPPIPVPPTDLVLTVLPENSIKIDWLDNSDIEDETIVYRSIGSNTNYLPLATIPGTREVGSVVSYTDNGLLANTTYYYRLGVENVGGAALSDEESLVMPNTAPDLEGVDDISMRFGSVFNVQVFAEDLDGENLTITSGNLPAFASFVDYGDGTALIQFSPSSSDLGEYPDILITVEDQNGGQDSDLFTLVVSNNNLPSLQSIDNVMMDEGSNLQLSILGADVDGTELLQWTTIGLPSFAVLTPHLDGSADLALQPDYTDKGVYEVEVKIEDPEGSVSVQSFVIEVNDVDPNLKVYVNIMQNTTVTEPWNNIVDVNNTPLLDENGEDSGVSFDFQTSAWNVWHDGAVTDDGSGVFPDNVLKDYFYFGIFGAPETVSFKLAGLDDNKGYKINLMGGSQWTGVADNGETVYTINGNSVSLDVQNNTQNLAYFANVVPNNGEVLVEMSKGVNTQVGYINAMVLEYVYGEGTIPAPPRDLSVIFEDNVMLNWVDAPFNEDGFEVYRSETENGVYALVSNPIVPEGSESFVDLTVEEGRAYFYKVRSVNEVGNSVFSNIVNIDVPNKAPIISNPGLIQVIVGETSEFNISAIDLPDNNIVLSLEGLPSWASFVDNGGGDGILTMTPNEGDIGLYEGVRVKAEDADGKFSTMPVSLEVKEDLLYSIYVNFGKNYTAPSPWNNTGKSPQNGESFNGLVNDFGEDSGIGITLLTSYGGHFDEGAVTGDNSGVVPDNVLQEYYWFGIYGAPNTVSMKVTGLENSNTYNFKFIGSSVFTGAGITDNGETVYSIGNRSESLYVQGNTTNMAVIKDVTTNAAGEVVIEISKGVGASIGFINGIIIEAMEGDEQRFYPSGLKADGISNSEIELGWVDNAFDESGYEIYRSDDGREGNYQLISTVMPNTDSYTDSGLSSGVVYYYKVKALLPENTISAFSNVANSGVVSYSVFVNINGSAVYDAPAPWNNLSSAPDDGVAFVGLKNEKGNESGLRLFFEKAMQGSNDWGASTGDNSGVYPDLVMQSFFFNDAFDTPGNIIVEGLDMGYKYNFTFFGSIVTNFNIATDFTVNGNTVSNSQANNVSDVSEIKGVIPDSNNEISFTVKEAASSRWAIFNALVIEASPTDQEGVLVSRNGNVGFRNAAEMEVKYGNSGVEVSFFPNPVDEQLNIMFEEGSRGSVDIELLDAIGRIVYSKHFDNQEISGKLELNLGGVKMEKGVYLVKAIFANGDLRVGRVYKK